MKQKRPNRQHHHTKKPNKRKPRVKVVVEQLHLSFRGRLAGVNGKYFRGTELLWPRPSAMPV